MPSDTKRKEARKRKFGALTTESQPANTASTALDVSQADDVPMKKMKLPEGEIVQADSAKPPAADAQPTATATAKAQRFIVFIGNLPYTATDTAIATHFAKVQPVSIRHRTDKVTGKSKGFAFLEFRAYDRMKTCLKLYHQTSFGGGDGEGRRLNVELTAGGGGGKSLERKMRLRVRNERLNEQRRRRVEEEGKVGEKGKGAERVQALADSGAVHPSRRSRVAAGSNGA